MTAPKPKLLTIADVAALLNVSERTVRNLVDRGDLAKPCKVAGKLARWFPQDVRDYLGKLRSGR